ncbi:glycerate kinase [Parabacteroides faecis]|uniref:glycerate kinase n=1 Tax=Parabacteroides TaxID=375288 RepID=UPI000EFEDE59|nr:MULTISPECIES: glycerate kinase [Parabacteroides]MBC8619972.1 glycerate kinase [Parabacteroides faecis]RHR98813.1 glycerate kinase [Parabacteroides sp. AF14-59]
MKIVIAVDSFKGCLSSSSIANAVEEGIQNTLPGCEMIKVPIADGGEGTVDALVDATQGKIITIPVHNPLMQPIQASYGMTGDGQTAIIEMSAASGLDLIPLRPGNVMDTTTYGTGEMIADAIERGCRNFIIGVGGSATNDAGTGMMQALGVRFTDEEGNEVEKGGKSLSSIRHIDTQNQLSELQDCTFHIATDVTNPFYGPQGAACIFGPQKGGNEEQIKALDKGMKHLAELIFETTGKEIGHLPGAGAGGGMGGGCVAFLQANISPGIELIMDYLHFDEIIRGAGLVITGEGKMDRQTLFGKVPVGIARAAASQQIPVIAITGQLDITADKELREAGLSAIFPIHPAPISLEKAMQPDYAYRNIRRTIEQICYILNLLF